MYAAYIKSSLQITFIMEANTMNQDHSDLETYCLQNRQPKYITRKKSRQQFFEWREKGIALSLMYENCSCMSKRELCTCIECV